MQIEDKKIVSNLKQTIAFQIEIFITIEHELFFMFTPLKLFLLIIGQLQILSFLIIPQRIEYDQSMDFQISISQYMNLVPFIARPYTIFFTDVIFRQYSFCIILIWIMLMVSTFSFLQIHLTKANNQQKHFTLAERIHNLPSIVEIWIKIISAYLQLINIVLIIPSLELCLEAFILSKDNISNPKMTQENMQSHYTTAILSIVTIIILFTISGIRFLLTEETITTQINGFEKLNQTAFELCKLFLKTAQLMIYFFSSKLHNTIYIQIFLIACQSVINIANILLYYSLYDKILISYTLFIQSFNITMVLVYLIVNIAGGKQSQESIASIVLINFSFLFKLLIGIKNNQDIKTFLLMKKIQNPFEIQYQIFQNLFSDHSFGQNQLATMMQIRILQTHKSKCVDVVCHCKNKVYLVEDPKKVIYLTGAIFKDYNLILLKRLNKIQSKVKNSYDKFSLTLHYIAALSILGLNTQAFQQTNYLIYKQIFKETIKHDQDINHNSLHQDSMSKSQIQSQKSQSDVQRENINFKILNDRIKKQIRQMQINNIPNLSLIQIQKIKILQSMIKKKMNQNFTNQQVKYDRVNPEEISHAVNLFLESEYSNQILKIKIVHLMQLKLQFFNLLTSSTILSGSIIFQQSQQIGFQLYKTEAKLNQLYLNFPSQKIQSVICFFQAEIINNYLQAFKVASVTTIADETLMKMHRNLQINLFSNKISYLILGLSEKVNNISIIQCSNSAPDFFEYTKEEFKKYETIEFLLPQAIQRDHMVLVNQFLRTGQSKYFRNVNLNFFQRKDSFIQPMDFFYDINFNNQSQFSFATFFKLVSFTSAYIIVDYNGHVGGVTRNLFEKMAFKNSQIKQLNIQEIIYHLDIKKILPNFDDLVNQESEYYKDKAFVEIGQNIQIKYSNLSGYFLKIEAIQKAGFLNQSGTKHSNYLSNKTSMKIATNMWNNYQNLNQYQLSCAINIRTLLGIRYYIVEIDELKQIKVLNTPKIDFLRPVKTNEDDLKQSLTHEVLSSLNQNTDLDQENDWRSEQEILENLSPEKQINLPQSLFFHQLLDQDQTLQLNNEKHSFEIYGNQIHMNQRNFKYDENHINLINPDQSDDLIKQKNEIQLMLRPQINQVTSNSKKSIQNNIKSIVQQRFFSQKYSLTIENSSNQNNSFRPKPKENDLFQHDIQGIDEEFKQNVLQMLQDGNENKQNIVKVDDVGSIAESIAGVRKSPFFKKYDMLVQVIQSVKNPFQIISMNALLTLKFILAFAFSVIILINVEVDLQKFVQQVDLLEITNHFLAPQIQFTIDKIGIQRYDSMLSDGLINNSTHDVLKAYLLKQVIIAYDQMKTQYEQQFENIYLQNFFQNRYIVIAQGVNGTSNPIYFNMTLRSALEILLYDLFVYYNAYTGVINRSTLGGSSSFYYQYSNMMNFVRTFETLSAEVLKLNGERVTQIQIKWYSVWIPFIILTVILMICAWFCYIFYLRKLEKMMTMFKYITLDSIEKDKDRYKLLLNFLNRDSDLIFRYQFNLDQKEKILFVTKNKKDSTQNQTMVRIGQGVQINKGLIKLKLPILRSIIIFISIFSIFAVFSTIINNQTQVYLDKFDFTAKLFKQFSDIGFYLPTLFLAREILVNKTAYAMLTADDYNNFYIQVNYAQENLDQFINIMTYFEPDLYLVSNQFTSDFKTARLNSICQFLDPTLQNSSSFYCQNSFGGILNRGLMITISTFRAHFLTEQSVNNFTLRYEYPYLQIEGEFITQKVTEFLKSSLKTSIVVITLAHVNEIDTFCIIIIVYSIIAIIMVHTISLNYLRFEYMIFKRLILLMPSTSLFFDDQFERVIRLLLVQERII